MDITMISNENSPSAATKSPEHDTETPTRITTPTTTKTLSFSNGVLKRHPYPHHHHPSRPISASFTYKECLKNHAANLGGHALDGCGEFMPSPTAAAADPSSIKCAACGCHRNFHRHEPEESPIPSTTHVIEYQPHHRHHPPPPSFAAATATRSPSSASPPPISSSYYPSAPHMLLALSAGLAVPPESTTAPSLSLTRKRFRTKFTLEQKEKMHKFAEKVGWKMQRRDDHLIHDFCMEVGIHRSVLKVWMHNNKNTFAKKDNHNNNDNIKITSNINDNDANGGDKSFEDPNTKDGISGEDRRQDLTRDHFSNVGANGSSSTS